MNPKTQACFINISTYQWNKLKRINIKNARTAISLLAEEDDIKVVDKDPGLDYIKYPKHITLKDIKDELRKESKEQFNKLGHYNRKGKLLAIRLRWRWETLWKRRRNFRWWLF